MNNLKNYVNWKLTHADKTAEVEGYPLVLENCKANKRMKQLEIYGNSVQDGTPTPDNPIEVQSVGELVTDVNDVNYGKYKIPVVQRGINLTDGIIEVKGISNSTGQNSNSTSYFRSTNYTSVSPNTPYTLTASKPIQFVYFYDKDYNFIKSSGENAVYFTTPENCEYIRYRIIRNGSLENEVIDKVMLTKGTNIIPYEPYVEPITTNIFLDEPLRKIGDYADYVDFKENKVVRNIRLLNGEQMARYNIWKYSNSSHNVVNAYRFAFDLLSVPGSARNLNIVCSNMFEDGSFISHKALTGVGYSEGGFLYLRFDDENNYGVTDIATFKSFLTTYNPFVYFVRSNPTEEHITCELPKLTAKTTIIEVDTSLVPSNIHGKYIKR